MSKNKGKPFRKLAKRIVPIYAKAAAEKLRTEDAKRRRLEKESASKPDLYHGQPIEPIARVARVAQTTRQHFVRVGTGPSAYYITTTGRLVTFQSTVEAGKQYNEPNPTARPGGEREKRLVAKWRKEQELNKRRRTEKQPMRAKSLPPKVGNGLMADMQKPSRRTNRKRRAA